VIALAIGVAITSAYLFSRAEAPVYRSSIRLEIVGRVDYGQILAIDRLLRQLASRVRTTAVAAAVDARLQTNLGADAILGKITTQALADAIQVQVEVDDTDPLRAERIAAALGEIAQEQQAALMSWVPEGEQILVNVVDRPSPGRFVWPQARSILAGAALVGLVFGAFLALGLDYADDRVRTAADVSRWLGLPLLGAVPHGGHRPSTGHDQ
jgi:capsular polysaccharide biosynthesis protein